ncbi:MAG: hypothetical protein FJ288_08910 [Planctomycetes bacterium]|nr:hypothetical protein [Planctomycetota bacterium]
MPWTPDRWPTERFDPIDAACVLNEMRAALAERNTLVPAGWVPGHFSRWGPLRGTPKGGSPVLRTVANLQHQVQEMLTLAWPLRWWDLARDDLYTLANLCQDAFGAAGWTWDLTAEDGQGQPLNPWSPAAAVIFGELYHAANTLNRLRILPTFSASQRRDSVYRLTTGIASWPQERAATFALFDGEDDGQTVELEYDAGMGGQVFDDGSNQHWLLESRQFAMSFATEALAGCEVACAWLDFATAAPAGQADYQGTFTAEVIDGDGNALGTFASDDYGTKRFDVPAPSIRTDGDSVFVIRSTRPDAADRPAWNPPGPNYTSSYREGLAAAGPMRLIVEVNLEYRA